MTKEWLLFLGRAGKILGRKYWTKILKDKWKFAKGQEG